VNDDAGIVITASHNPPHDTAIKFISPTARQVIEPHASGIIAKVNAINVRAMNRSRKIDKDASRRWGRISMKLT